MNYHSNIVGVGWTEERVEFLREKWLLGWSATEIARGLGGTVSRNAVCGKIDRLNLPTRNKLPRQRQVKGKPFRRAMPEPDQARHGSAKRRRTKAEDKRDEAERRNAAARLADRLPAMMATELTDLPPEDASRAISFFDAEAGQCRWPIGDPLDLDSFRFCGAGAAGECPYCARHARMAYQPRSAAA